MASKVLSKKKGTKVVGIGDQTKRLSAVELVEAVNIGLPAKMYVVVQKETGLSQTEIADILGVSTRYLQDKKQSDLLNTTASERLVKLREIWDFGLDVFNGNEGNFKEWLNEPLAPLNGKSPMYIMTNFIGMEQVKQLLGRIQYGVYS